MKYLFKALAAIMLLSLTVIVAGCKPKDEPNGGGENGGNNDGNLNDHAYVDLGLPSGTLWATCNIGAEMFY